VVPKAEAWSDHVRLRLQSCRVAYSEPSQLQGAALAELRRQADLDRRATASKLQKLERRLTDHVVSSPTREGWADVQGSVIGVIEEVAALARRFQSLEESS